MRLPSDRNRHAVVSGLHVIAIVLTLILATWQSNAAVTVVWAEDVSGVTATYSGSMAVASFPNDPSAVSESAAALRNNQAFSYFDGGVLDRYDLVGSATVLPAAGEMGIQGVGSGDVFGFSVDSIFVPSGYVSDSPLSGKIVFAGKTLDDLFNGTNLVTLLSSGITAWQSTDGSETVAYTAVPEPSSQTILMSLGLAFLFFRRR